MSWVGIDPGEKRTGLARMDGLEIAAHPKGIVSGYQELVSTLQEWFNEELLSGLIIGLPRNMNGTIGPIAQRSIELKAKLQLDLDSSIAIYLWDERLSTQQVVNQGNIKSASQHIDDKVAAVILQSYVDAGKPVVADPE